MRKHIPNLFTLGNLFCGIIAAIFAVNSNFRFTALFVVCGIVLDFLDGFLARLLKVSGELGKQLDSLADMVTSGAVPGIVMFKLMELNLYKEPVIYSNNQFSPFFNIHIIGLVLTLGACYRLAKFNLDTRQSDFFIGLPTPAMCLFVISLPIILENADNNLDFVNDLISNNYFLIIITLALTYLMNAEIPLFSLKFKDFSFKKNFITYLFLICCVILIFSLYFLSIPIIIITYITLSIIKNLNPKIQ